MDQGHFEISGKIAEIIDDNSGRYIRVICSNKNMILELDKIEDISLGETVKISGEFHIRSISVHGVKIETKHKN